MMTIHINRPQVWLGRTVDHCTTCRRRRRFIVRLFEWYSSRWICGGCGHEFVSGEGRVRSAKTACADRRTLVKTTWPNVPNKDEALRTMLDALSERTN